LNGLLGMAVPDNELAAGGDVWLNTMQRWGTQAIRTDCRMEHVMTAPGFFDWAQTDRLVEGCRSRGMRVLLVLGCGMLMDNPAARAQFRTFAEAAAIRYKGKVAWWEILNEANMTYLRPASYALLLRAVYPAIKAVQPKATIIYGGNASIPSEKAANLQGAVEYLERVYAAGGRNFFNAVAHHPYQYPYTYAQDVHWGGMRIMNRIREVMNANGDQNKLLWITEVGAPTGGSDRAVTEATQALMLRQIVAMARAPGSGLGPVFWYSFQDRKTNRDSHGAYFGCRHQFGREKLVAADFRRLAPG